MIEPLDSPIPRNVILQGDALATLRTLPDACVQCCVTSPPYWQLRDYGVAGQLGMEPTLDDYLAALVDVFREVRRVLRDDGTCWLNLGDAYASGGCGPRDANRWPKQSRNDHMPMHAKNHTGLKAKDLIGLPWRVAFALQAGGWWLRSDIVWSKPNPMPESVTDRPTRAHEYVFLLTKSARYYYDAAAIREPLAHTSVKRICELSFDQQRGGPKDGLASGNSHRRALVHLRDKQLGHSRRHDGFNDRWDQLSKEDQLATGANRRDVWTIACEATPEAHFATFPQALVTPCILAGSRQSDLILDPFFGSGTVGVVAQATLRDYLGIELNPAYIAMARARIARYGRRARTAPVDTSLPTLWETEADQ